MEALMNEALERINRQYGIRLMLEKARPGCVFPKVDVMGKTQPGRNGLFCAV